MSINPSSNGWSRVASGIDVEIQHGVPVRICHSDTAQHLSKKNLSEKVHELTGFNVSVHDWISVAANERELSVCVEKKDFEEVLRRLALSSAAMFVDRFHKPIDRNAVDWDNAEYNYDFNHAIEHCCIPWGTLNKKDYFNRYIEVMHEESVRLVKNGISPLVEAE